MVHYTVGKYYQHYQLIKTLAKLITMQMPVVSPTRDLCSDQLALSCLWGLGNRNQESSNNQKTRPKSQDIVGLLKRQNMAKPAIF